MATCERRPLRADRNLVVSSIRRGSKPRQGFFLPSWSRDGKHIGLGCYHTYGAWQNLGLWIFDLNTKKLTKVAEGSITLPAWSPDGSKMTFDLRAGECHEIWMIETKSLEVDK